jgi:ABC-type multidrug transport system permease subunit
MVRAGEKIIFTFFIGIVMLAALYIAKDWPIRASIIILLLGTIGVIMSCIQFVYDLKDARADNAKIVRPTYEIQAIEHQGRWGSLEIWAWLWGLFFAIHLIGFAIALPLFVFLYVKLYGGSWSTAIILTALTSGFLHGLYDYLLSVPWPKPWLSILF